MSAPDQRERDRATDIGRSVIVQAPAGSGKTTLLVRRFLKLLAVVDKPEEILAITFTRKAASEMANRVMAALEHASRGARDPDAEQALARSDALGWQLLTQPARLKIQTIDSLAMALTRSLPVAAGFDPGLDLTETAQPLYQTAANRLLLRLYEDDPLAGEIADFLSQCDNDAARAERLLAGMLEKRDQWLEVVRQVVAAHRDAPDQVAGVLSAGIRSLNETVIGSFRAQAGAQLAAELDALVDHAASERGLRVDDAHARYRLAGEILTTARGEFRQRVNKNQGFKPEHREEKARLKDLIEALSERGLGEQVASLRHLPDPELNDDSVQRLANTCVNLALANAELNAVFQQAGTTDFTTLILNAQAALGDALDPSELALALDYRIHHVLVDEFQDTSVAQFRLFERLLHGWTDGDGNTFFAVGDPMQSIYRFRDADVSLFYRAWTRGIADLALDTVVLTSNFRADARLVRFTNEAFARILGKQEDPVLGRIAYRPATPTRDAAAADPAAQLHRYESLTAQVAGIAAHVEHLLESTEDNIALLVRSRGQLTALLRTFRRRGISWHANDIDPLLDKPAVRDLLALVGALVDPWDRLRWMSLLRSPLVGLHLTDLQALAGTSRFPDLLEAVRTGRCDCPDLSASGRERLERLAEAWQLAARLDEAPARSVVETLWLTLGGADAYADPGALVQATRLLELIDESGPHEGLDADVLSQAATHLFAADLTQSRLQILTIHKAKGLEFDHVLLPFLEYRPRPDGSELLLWRALPEGLLMGVRDDEGPHIWLARENSLRERHERQRLLYVACTRARQSLTLFAGDDDRPPETSMLAMLQPLLENGTLEPAAPSSHDIDADAAVVPDSPTQADLFELPEPEPGPPPLQRLVDGYRWTPPPLTPLPVPPIATAPRGDLLEARTEVVLGIVLHAALERLAKASLPAEVDAYISSERGGWDRAARDHALTESQVAEVVAAVSQQLAGVLADATGRWLLEAREAAHAEFPVTTVVDDHYENLIVDRTFVDAGERWVVDYKTSVPPPGSDEETFLIDEVSRYRPQLTRYGEAAEALFGEPVRLALYFTAFPRLVEL